MDEVAEVSDELMERYLEGEEISHEEIVHALKNGVTNGTALPGHLRRRHEEPGDQPPARRARRGPAVAGQEGRLPRRRPRHRGRGRGRDDRVRVQDARRPVRRARSTCSASTTGVVRAGHAAVQHAARTSKERMGQLLVPQGKEMEHADELGAGRHRRGREAEGDARGRRARVDGRAASRSRCPSCPSPVMAFAIEPKHKGDEDKVFTALRRLQEEDPTIDVHRDDQTGEQIVAGLTQIHVEVIVDRMKERFGAEVTLKPPRVPVPRDDQGQREGARPLQEADRRPRPVRRLPHRDRAARRRRRPGSSSRTRSRAA